MQLEYTGVLYALSFALDAVEREVNGAEEGHGMRVAWLSYCLARGLGYTNEETTDLMACAILHDNAMAEYRRDMHDNGGEEKFPVEIDGIRIYDESGIHALMGEENIRKLPFNGDVSGVILGHHENADGSGPFHMREGETDIRAEIIRLTDCVDIDCELMQMSESDFDRMTDEVRRQSGKLFSKRAVELMDKNLRYSDIEILQKLGVQEVLKKYVPSCSRDFSDDEIHGIAGFFAGIVDVKSSYTRNHSMGVAQKAAIMAEHYGFSHDKAVRFFFAGAMHDIGKMVIANDILEKPDRLNDEEFRNMQNHAVWTYRILSGIEGLEDVTEWASDHHEKLDGSGYPRGLRADQLTFEDRLMACIDIYQALTESRSYKEGIPHNRTMSIMRGMVSDGKIDADITEEIDRVFGTGEKDAEESVKVTGWKCPVCGYVCEGEEPPAFCPVCGTPGDDFARTV